MEQEKKKRTRKDKSKNPIRTILSLIDNEVLEIEMNPPKGLLYLICEDFRVKLELSDECMDTLITQTEVFKKNKIRVKQRGE